MDFGCCSHSLDIRVHGSQVALALAVAHAGSRRQQVVVAEAGVGKTVAADQSRRYCYDEDGDRCHRREKNLRC